MWNDVLPLLLLLLLLASRCWKRTRVNLIPLWLLLPLMLRWLLAGRC